MGIPHPRGKFPEKSPPPGTLGWKNPRPCPTLGFFQIRGFHVFMEIFILMSGNFSPIVQKILNQLILHRFLPKNDLILGKNPHSGCGRNFLEKSPTGEKCPSPWKNAPSRRWVQERFEPCIVKKTQCIHISLNDQWHIFSSGNTYPP